MPCYSAQTLAARTQRPYLLADFVCPDHPTTLSAHPLVAVAKFTRPPPHAPRYRSLFKMSANQDSFVADQTIIKEAFNVGWDEHGRTQRKKMSPREEILFRFGRMRALGNMLCLNGAKFSESGPSLYSWDGDFISRAELERRFEEEAKALLAAKKRLTRAKRVNMLQYASIAYKRKKAGLRLAPAQQEALYLAQKEGKYLSDDSEDEGEAAAPKLTAAGGEGGNQ